VLPKQVLSQLSYTPTGGWIIVGQASGLGQGKRRIRVLAASRWPGLDARFTRAMSSRSRAGGAFWQPRTCRRMMMRRVFARNIESVRREFR